jgi:phage gpG-like protein
MPLEFAHKVESSRLEDGIRALSDRAQDWRAAWPAIAGHLTRIFAAQFDGEGARDRWAPLTEDYARRKQKLYPGRSILQATRRLWQSLVGKTSDTIDEHQPLRMTFGTRLPYASYLQSGTGKGLHRTGGVPTGRGTGRGMAQRAILDLLPQDQTAVANEIARQASALAQGAGFALSGGAANTALAGRSAAGLEPGRAIAAIAAIGGGPAGPLSSGI